MGFFANEITSYPDGDFIDNIHRDRLTDWDWLEYHHGFIQWIFPIREPGMNYHAEELQLHEITAICSDREKLKRLIRSYEMMLGFYGMLLADKEKGTIERSLDWKNRFAHLKRSSHNYLRITRILKCLGELAYEHYKLPFIMFVLREVYETKELARLESSALDFWAGTLRNDNERWAVEEYAMQHGRQPQPAPKKRWYW
eukprot:NODE_1481_length_858_cov_185.796044_g1227_i0.p1 GENE.NODE_1481_length_858_cov_185.796044_g1227_i0~~NODE_1481_length_858_cov_185.796044_g1227_i0.p1  ORF type:complete len:199 (+),score=28.11 NODE_1481_length_858_cov_185.796044_g1227_i0:28-624(+)